MARYQKRMDGEWVHWTRKGHLVACCDCGLVHLFKPRVRMQDWLFELWSATDMGKDGDYRKRLAELMDEIATLRSEVRFLLDHVGGLENASGLRLEDEDRRRYEAIAERYWGVIPD